jgi:hypothetical protein
MRTSKRLSAGSSVTDAHSVAIRSCDHVHPNATSKCATCGVRSTAAARVAAGTTIGSVLTVGVPIKNQQEKAMSSAEGAVVDAASPLEDAGIFLHVLNIVGPGHQGEQGLERDLRKGSWCTDC